MDNVHDGHRARLKNKFIGSGFANMTDHQKLEMILFFAIPRCDTNPIAHRLMNRFGSLNGVFSADHKELCTVKGVGKNTATFIKLMGEMSYADMQRDAELHSISDVNMILDLVKSEFKEVYEPTTKLICADDQMNLTEIITLSGNEANIYEDSKVLYTVLSASCAQVVMISYSPETKYPDDGDKATARALKEALGAFNIVLSDYVMANREYANYLFSGLRLPVLWNVRGTNIPPANIKRREVRLAKKSPRSRKIAILG